MLLTALPSPANTSLIVRMSSTSCIKNILQRLPMHVEAERSRRCMYFYRHPSSSYKTVKGRSHTVEKRKATPIQYLSTVFGCLVLVIATVRI